MANPGLFGSRGPATPPADTTNQAGGLAYQLTPKHALAQLAATGFFSDTYYADAQSQLDSLLTLVAQVDDDRFLARLAIYSRQRGKMKDMPAALLAVLSVRAPQLIDFMRRRKNYFCRIFVCRRKSFPTTIFGRTQNATGADWR